MKIKLVFLILLISILFPQIVFATSGSLQGDSITTCNGVTYGYHSDHWHIAIQKGNRWYPDGNPIYSNPCGNENSGSNTSTENNSNSNSESITDNKSKNNNTSVSNVTKSNDNTLKSISINSDNIDVSDNMNYTTNTSSIEIVAIANDNNAKVTISDYSTINTGDNNITISVIAENGNEKIYNLLIHKNSNNTNIEIMYNNEKISFNTSNEAEIKTEEDKISFTIIPEEKIITTDLKDIYTLNYGDNKIVITATAEDGTTKKYTINVIKESTGDLIIGFIVLIICGGIAYMVIKISKKNKEKYYNK